MKDENKEPNILIVDDNPDNIRLLTNFLADKNYRIRAVTNGARALSTIEKQHPDLILLDVMMADMDGFEVCRRLKQNNITSNIPVIFLSAHKDEEIIDKAKAVGAVDYLAKPFFLEEIVTKIQKVIN